MKSLLKPLYLAVVAAMFTVCVESSYAQGAINATATISATAAGGGLFNYTITLQNTGTSALQSLWYGWTPSGDNLNPSTLSLSGFGSSLGWSGSALGNSIVWQGNGSDMLAGGASATFTFESDATLAQITASPSGESFAYTGGFDASPSTSVFSPVVAVPEPSSLGLLAAGLPVALLAFRRLKISRK